MDNLINQDARDLFIEEPVNKIIDEINNIEGNIVLTGPINSGKTLILKNLIKKNKNRDIEYVVFNNCLTSFSMGDHNEQELIHLIELSVFCNIYFNNFGNKLKGKYKSIADNVLQCSDILNKYSTRKSLGVTSDITFLKYGELSKKVIDILKSEGKKVSVVFDRFEGINRDVVQKTLIKYADIFDQCIIVASDEMIAGNEIKLGACGYKIVQVDYSKNPKFMEQYINELVRLYYKGKENCKDDYYLPSAVDFIDFFGKENLHLLVAKSDGDINFAMGIIRDVNKMIEWYGYRTINASPEIKNGSINRIIALQETGQEKTKKMYPKKTIRF